MSETEYHPKCQECGFIFHTIDIHEAEFGICEECRERLGIELPNNDVDEFDYEHR